MKKLLVQWYADVQAIRQAQHDLEVVGFHIEAPAFKAMDSLVEHYTDILAYKAYDRDGWLEYFLYECDLGEAPKLVINFAGKQVVLKDVDSLMEVLEYVQ